MRLLLRQDWEQVNETAYRILQYDPNNIHSTIYQALHLVVREGDYQEATNKIGDLLEKLDRLEPRNGQLYHRLAQLFRFVYNVYCTIQYTVLTLTVSSYSSRSSSITQPDMWKK